MKTRGKRGRLEGALRAWRGLTLAHRANLVNALLTADACPLGKECEACSNAKKLAARLLRAAGVETRKERK